MRLELRGLGKRLGGKIILDGLDLHVDDGENVAVVGPNGVGKSTMLKIVAGVLPRGEGDVLLDGESLLAHPRLRAHVGYVPEGADPLPHLTVGELLDLTASLRRTGKLPEAQRDRLGVAPILHQRLGTLSLGQRRRACLAAALVGEPWLLLMDEPTNGLSVDGIAELAGLLRERRAAGKSCLVATHDAAFAEAITARIAPLTAPRSRR
jgi:ABC-2 type transport system ATP-binding protein